MKVVIGTNPMGLEKAIPDLQAKYPEIEFVHVKNPQDAPAAIADADVYMGWMNRDLFLAAKKLKWVQSPSSGINYYLAIPEFVTSDVLLTSASGTHGPCLAESTFGMILGVKRQIIDSAIAQRKHEWAAPRGARLHVRADRQHHGHHRLRSGWPRHRQARGGL